jgi:single-strand DNA-binding protein
MKGEQRMNNVFLLGRITKEPEVRQTTGGKSYCRFTLAVDRDKDSADFIPCVCWGDNAQNMAKYVVKGQQLLVQGKMQSGSYKDDSGNTRYTLDAFIYRIDFLSKPKGASDGVNGFHPIDDDELPF